MNTSRFFFPHDTEHKIKRDGYTGAEQKRGSQYNTHKFIIKITGQQLQLIGKRITQVSSRNSASMDMGFGVEVEVILRFKSATPFLLVLHFSDLQINKLTK